MGTVFSDSGTPSGCSGGVIGFSDSSTAGAFFSICEAIAAGKRLRTSLRHDVC
eukprot:CAMPEP_0119488424 /NCGR_PEP_ID=MMETSP1344-20130328/14216_1 /TAXON_ID=236787 /ORGANISM="Florenciella parvula, Strain CCMP2471" /LENGTH=52 /DNA_ID=CAMNT_0007523379 /DNA_START=41 /DNA_END=196 /DNA_ORIENTATION=+